MFHNGINLDLHDYPEKINRWQTWFYTIGAKSIIDTKYKMNGIRFKNTQKSINNIGKRVSTEGVKAQN